MTNPTVTAPPAKRSLLRRAIGRLARHGREIRDHLHLRRLDRRARAHFRKFPPVFIVGAPRSGTTLLLQVLAAQPQFTRSFEPFRIWQQVFGRRPDDAFRGALPARQQMKLRTEFFAQLEPDRPVLLAKDPRDSLRVDVLRRVFPTGRFIHIVRDGRDVIASIIKAFEKGGIYHVEPGWAHVRFPGYRDMFNDPHHRKAAHMWRICVETVVKDLEQLPADKRATIRYEDLLARPEEEATKLMRLIDPGYSREALMAVLPFISATVGKTGGEDSGAPASPPAGAGFEKRWAKSDVAFDAGSGTLSSSVRVGKWRSELSDEVLGECDAIIGPMMSHFRYE